jgi:hypothetical protein
MPENFSTVFTEKFADSLKLLKPDEYKIAWPFFKNFKINEPMLCLTLERRGVGTVLTNNTTNPSFALVYNPASYTFLNGELDSGSLQAVSLYLKTLPGVSLACPTDWKYKSFFEQEGFKSIDRVQFQRNLDLTKVYKWKSQLPSTYRVSNISEKNFHQCKWRQELINFYGSAERFFDQAKGVCLSDENGLVISESYALISTGKAEIGVVTDENYRGKNLGTIVCAFVLDYCYTQDLKPFWSCDLINPASSSIAKKLGFEEDCRYVFLKWPGTIGI